MGNLVAFSIVILRVQISIVGHSLFAPTLVYEKLKKIKGLEGLITSSKELQTCDVIILSNQTPSYLMQKLLKYLFDFHQVHPIFLQCPSL